jgi:hypothetical protein
LMTEVDSGFDEFGEDLGHVVFEGARLPHTSFERICAQGSKP